MNSHGRRSEDVEDNMNRVLSLYNGLLKRSDEYGEENHKPSRPGGELRYLVEGHTAELFESGIAIDSDGFLSFSDEAEIKVPEKFITDLASKAEQMSMNPMEYVDKKVYSYAHLYQSDIAATANCPMLCVIPPAILTPKAEMCKRFLFFNKFMIIRLSTLPARLYRNPNRLPKVKAFNSPRTMLTVSAWQKPFLYKTSTITRLASPSLIPGNGIGSGKRLSI